MAKPSRGVARNAGKKKAKKRSEPRPVTPIRDSVVAPEPVQSEAVSPESSGRTVLQFRPRARDDTPARAAVARVAGSARAAQYAADYSYVYTDMRIIGGLSVLLFGGLAALAFVLR